MNIFLPRVFPFHSPQVPLSYNIGKAGKTYLKSRIFQPERVGNLRVCLWNIQLHVSGERKRSKSDSFIVFSRKKKNPLLSQTQKNINIIRREGDDYWKKEEKENIGRQNKVKRSIYDERWIKNASVPRNLNACYPIIYFSAVGKRSLPIVGPSTELNCPEPKKFLDLIVRNPRWYSRKIEIVWYNWLLNFRRFLISVWVGGVPGRARETYSQLLIADANEKRPLLQQCSKMGVPPFFSSALEYSSLHSAPNPPGPTIYCVELLDLSLLLFLLRAHNVFYHIHSLPGKMQTFSHN